VLWGSVVGEGGRDVGGRGGVCVGGAFLVEGWKNETDGWEIGG
jgi:hypothetical protein